jgi:hypothetical protein
MEEKIRENIHNPEELERIYRNDRKSFISGFEKIYSEIENSEIALYWKVRLDFDKTQDKINRISRSDIYILITSCLITGFLIKIPTLFNINITDILFYQKNAGIIVFLGLTIYTAWNNRISDPKRLVILIIAFLIPTVYINLLPSGRNSDSIDLAYIHLPLLMWCTYGLIFTDFSFKDRSKRIEYLRHNGDLAILGAIILLAGGVLTAITIGLFDAININIEKFYMDNVVIIGLASAPIVATFIIKNYTLLTSKIAPVIANIFSPLVLLTLLIYLIAIAISGKDPYTDRDFLLIFNIMLIGVMSIIVFSITETSMNRKQKFNGMILFILSIITLIIDLIALSAPNRLAVLGSNILIFGNLILIMIEFYKINFKKSNIVEVGLIISNYLPVYIFWILIVIFGFPAFFGMK